MALDLASFPFARQGQVPADADTYTLSLVAGTEYPILPASEDRAYVLLRNLTGGTLLYYYSAGNDANGFTVKPFDTVRIVNRMPIFIKGASSGTVCYDVGIG